MCCTKLENQILYEFTRVPFGMINSGRTFVKAINMVLQPINEFAEPYVDGRLEDSFTAFRGIFNANETA